jgi:hypothetical protein
VMLYRLNPNKRRDELVCCTSFMGGKEANV